ncbi:hypothetical protein C8A05DRAFT_48048 [Staphylotrichum tortipilum]|uniref:Uncharacterized protein n=1 Tax=Staphylotrichum tortipilum TaxID=2831512 RepID=A0AAN6MAP1_9PEZI|nr:hypothetical protein C8A05DRAFT_48048 [Staphylotrichum longicolle]
MRAQLNTGGSELSVEPFEPKYFRDLGSKRSKITYGPFDIPGSEDAATRGMVSFHDMNAMIPCHDCLITGFVSALQFLDGKSANANKNMWLHHTGLDEPQPHRPGLTRRAGYYLRKGDEIFQTVDVMNRLNETTGIKPTDTVFTARGGDGWVSKYSGDLVLAVPHIHDGNTKQELYLDGQLVCTNVPRYAETSEFITHLEEDGHEHDHGSSEHIYHVSSITQCANVGKVVLGNRFTLASWYDLVQHAALVDHHGDPEPIMAIEFLYLARPQEEAIKDILAMKPGDLKSFQDQVRENTGGKEPASG